MSYHPYPNSQIEYKLNTRFVKLIKVNFNGTPTCADPAGLVSGSVWHLALFGKSFLLPFGSLRSALGK